MLTYLASPYSAKGYDFHSPEAISIRDARFINACKVAAILMEDGYNIFAPIPHSDPIERYGITPRGIVPTHDFWLKQDFAVLEHCGLLLVCTMHEWDKSYGISEEVKFAKKNNIPVKYVDQKGNITDEPVSRIYPSKQVCTLSGPPSA